jgi:hypothetical protein
LCLLGFRYRRNLLLKPRGRSRPANPVWNGSVLSLKDPTAELELLTLPPVTPYVETEADSNPRNSWRESKTGLASNGGTPRVGSSSPARAVVDPGQVVEARGLASRPEEDTALTPGSSDWRQNQMLSWGGQTPRISLSPSTPLKGGSTGVGQPSLSGAGAGRGPLGRTDTLAEISTNDLVRELNERLQSPGPDVGEFPPLYEEPRRIEQAASPEMGRQDTRSKG